MIGSLPTVDTSLAANSSHQATPNLYVILFLFLFLCLLIVAYLVTAL
jgi:hypothetical protein